MTYNIKLKTGFFKTQQYTLEISYRKITLTQKEINTAPVIVIKISELNNVSIIKCTTNLIELEINTANGIYIGNLDLDCNMDELICDLTQELGSEYIIQ